MGAADVVDYTRDTITGPDHTARYDAILDVAGNRPLSQLRMALTPHGTLVIVGEGGGRILGMGRAFRAVATSPFVGQNLRNLLARTGNSAAWYGSKDYRAAELTSRLTPLISTMCWAYADLPAGDPVRDGVPEAARLLRERLAHPGLILPAGAPDVRAAADWAEQFGPEPYRGPVELPDDTTFDDGLTITASRGRGSRSYFRPAFYGLDERTAELDATVDHGHATHAVRFLTGPMFARIVERVASGALAPGAHEADPRASVSDIVRHLADHLGLAEEPATLYLQLLALAQPTDARVKKWNGWRPAQHKQAVAKLLARGLVVEDKRPKAGRGVFLPGDWTKAVKAPQARPIETWKADLLTSLNAPTTWPWPRRPLADLFAAARDRVLAGDTPS